MNPLFSNIFDDLATFTNTKPCWAMFSTKLVYENTNNSNTVRGFINFISMRVIDKNGRKISCFTSRMSLGLLLHSKQKTRTHNNRQEQFT